MNKFKVGDKVVRVKPSSILEQGGIYTISQIMQGACWVGIDEYQDKDSGGYPFDEDSFELYQEPLCPVYADPITEQNRVITNWLGKLEYVLVKDPTVGYGLLLDSEDTLTLSTDFSDMIGSDEIVEFINNRYSQLTEKANKTKRESLLADIVKAKSEYEKLVGDLAELEGK